MLFKDVKKRKIISQILKNHNMLFKRHDSENDLSLSLNLSDVDQLYSELKFISQETRKRTKQHLSDDLSLGYLGILLTGYLCLSLQHDEQIDSALNNEKSRIVISNLILQIANHALSIINLIENGLDTSARTILRAIDELVYLTVYLTSNTSKIDVYRNLENPSKTWFENFRMELILKEISKLEIRLGLPEELAHIFKKQRSEFFKFYSEYIHNSYGVIMVGAYASSFDEEDILHTSLFGKESPSSKGTVANLNTILFYFNLVIFKILFEIHGHKSSLSNELWRKTSALHECFKTLYLETIEVNEM